MNIYKTIQPNENTGIQKKKFQVNSMSLQSRKKNTALILSIELNPLGARLRDIKPTYGAKRRYFQHKHLR